MDAKHIQRPASPRAASASPHSSDPAGSQPGGLEVVAQATDPTQGDPFVELGLVDHDRWVAPGGWRRGLIGFAVGAGAGWLVTVARRADGRAGTAGWGRP